MLKKAVSKNRFGFLKRYSKTVFGNGQLEFSCAKFINSNEHYDSKQNCT